MCIVYILYHSLTRIYNYMYNNKLRGCHHHNDMSTAAEFGLTHSVRSDECTESGFHRLSVKISVAFYRSVLFRYFKLNDGCERIDSSIELVS